MRKYTRRTLLATALLGALGASLSTQERAQALDLSLLNRSRILYFPAFADASPALTPRVGRAKLPILEAGTLLGFAATLDVAPLGSAVELEVIRTRGGRGRVVVRLTVPEGASYAETPNLSVGLRAGDLLSLNIAQVGSAVAGGYLTCVLLWKRS